MVCNRGIIGETDADGNFVPSNWNNRLTGAITWLYDYITNFTMIFGFDFKAVAY